MKWTDTMVRLLIMAVFYIGDEAGTEPADNSKKKTAAGGALQKKGKWKSVSRAMIEKGFCVSPQQCEDKFNDLNKRYKRVNDVLGKGTACRVVEDQSLLEKLDLSLKTKEEIKKLLNSKHLFFREMCAYHNSCGHLTTNAACQEQGNCQKTGRTNGEEERKTGRADEEEEGDDEESGDDSGNDIEDGDEEEGEAVTQRQNGVSNEPSGKRTKKDSNFGGGRDSSAPLLDGVIGDSTRSVREKMELIRRKIMLLEEERVGVDWEALELEKQKLKWMRFSGKKEREMERMKLENERKKLENERMVLILKQKEFELLDIHRQNHQGNQNDRRRQQQIPSSITG